jgi:hypothetical protein
MGNLVFYVRNQHIQRTDRFYPVKQSKNYLYATFQFGTKEWEGKIKSAIFSGEGIDPITVILEYDRCLIPWEVLECNMFTVSVFAGDLITVDTAEVRMYNTGYVEGKTPTEPTQTVYQQLIEKAEEVKGIFEATRKEVGENAAAAKTSEENAKQSEMNSAKSESNASISEQNAKISEQNTKESEESAKESKDSAKESAGNALSSENAAAESEKRTKEIADGFLVEINEAIDNAETATLNTVLATKDAVQATENAKNATNEAENATNAANSSVAVSQEAAENANKAITSANEAIDTANKAIEKANEEATNANRAAVYAYSSATQADAAAKACEGALDGMNTMVDTVTGTSCVLSVEDGLLVIREA